MNCAECGHAYESHGSPRHRGGFCWAADARWPHVSLARCQCVGYQGNPPTPFCVGDTIRIRAWDGVPKFTVGEEAVVQRVKRTGTLVCTSRAWTGTYDVPPRSAKRVEGRP
jgi:hypothetical protein